MGVFINKIGHGTSEDSDAIREGRTASYSIGGTGRKINPQGEGGFTMTVNLHTVRTA
jgi:hypothetical protein